MDEGGKSKNKEVTAIKVRGGERGKYMKHLQAKNGMKATTQKNQHQPKGGK